MFSSDNVLKALLEMSSLDTLFRQELLDMYRNTHKPEASSVTMRRKKWNEKFDGKPVKVLACREQEAVIFDESIKQQYEYALFPGMCGCVGYIISDNTQPNKIAIIHYLGGTDPDSILSFIRKNFLSKNISITTFSGNSGTDESMPEVFPTISPDAPTIKTSIVPAYDDNPFSERNYFLVALKNRYETNYILKSLTDSQWTVFHEHNDTVSFGDDVFLNLNDLTLSTNLNVNVLRDDFTPEEEADIFFSPDSVHRDTFMGRINKFINGDRNIVVTDKRSWKQYSADCVGSLRKNKHLLFYCGAAALTVALSASAIMTSNEDSDDIRLTY